MSWRCLPRGKALSCSVEISEFVAVPDNMTMEIVLLFVAILISPWLTKTFGIPESLINSLEPLLAIHILWVNLVMSHF